MHSLGHNFIPEAIHAGGLRYHGMAPLVSQGVVEGLMTPRAYPQSACFEAGVLWARTEGFIPAPETAHAIAAAIDEAKKAKAEGKEKVILFCWSGHGLMDLSAYDSYLAGRLVDHELGDAEIAASTACLKDMPQPKVARTGKW